jgi:hypothetical protein
MAAYASHGLIRAAMHFRWSFPDENLEFIHYEFGRTIFPRGSENEQIAVSRKIAERIAELLPMMGILPETIDDIGTLRLMQ